MPAETTTATTTTATGFIQLFGHKGDVRIEWDKNDRDSVEIARAQFAGLLEKYPQALIYKATRTGAKGQRITEFDATAERIVVVPRMAGGRA